MGVVTPTSIRLILTNKFMKTTDKYVFFWHGPFSNWHPAHVMLGDHIFANSEQAFMYLKAIFFGDSETGRLICKAATPKDAKDLGRQIKNYNDAAWTDVREKFMLDCCLAKFAQSEELKRELLATGDRILVEASPIDKVWGIGLAEDAPGVEDEANWQGQNLLGKVLMEVRERLK